MATLREVRLDLEGKLEKLSDVKPLLDEIGLQLLRETARRIWDRNEKSEGGKIVTSYSTEPLYVSVRASSKIKGKGKSPKSTAKFKNGKPRKTRYIGGGYKQLKTKVDRPLPLELTGQLKISYGSERQENAVLLGFEDTERKSFSSGVREAEKITNDELRISLEDKYGIFTAFSKGEEKLLEKIVEDFINRNL